MQKMNKFFFFIKISKINKMLCDKEFYKKRTLLIFKPLY